MSNRNQALSQLAIVFAAWLYVAGLHWQNDGLWFQGDAPRHAANGLFWKDFLLSGSLNPQDYALRYYARYPVISPTQYPPVFYLLEGALFAVFHPSPYAAKSLVLAFALLAACYLMAWLRRWVAAEAGWAADLLLLLPGFVLWSNAVMLNMPATAFSLAALYHARRWIEAPSQASERHQLYLVAAFSLLAALTYFLAGLVLFFVVLAWVLASRRAARLWEYRTVCVALPVAALFFPFLYVAIKWAPTHVSFVTSGLQHPGGATDWTFYLKELPELVGPLLLVASAMGLTIGVVCRRWRRESLLLLVFLLITYLSLSVIVAKEGRYALLLCVPIVCFCAMAVQHVAEWVGKSLKSGKYFSSAATLAVGFALCCAQGGIAAKTHVPRVQGLREVVAFLEQVAPNEPVFYDGYYNNVFTFYLQAADPGYRRRVVLGAKLLYASAINPMWRYRPYVSSSEDVIQVLQTRGGCRWLAIEMSEQSKQIPAATLLRDAVQGPQFELVRSFPVFGPGLDRIDVYRFKLDPRPTNEADLPFPILGEGARFKVRPIQR